jgi:hypothetical protein
MEAGLFAAPLAVMGMVIAFFTYRYSKAKLAVAAAKVGGEAAERIEIEQLKRRVATLERLLVDGDHKLANEIDRLQREDEFRPGA